MSTEVFVPASALPARKPRELMALARRGLDEAAGTRPAGARYAAAHLSTLRCAAAVIAHRARPLPPPPLVLDGRLPLVRQRPRSRPASAWVTLTQCAPELSEWASYFATTAVKRAAAEAGLPRAVTDREADEMLRHAEQFYGLVAVVCGLSAEEGRDR